MRWITANDLEAWARAVASETDMAELVGDLIRATATDITEMRFPSGDKGRVRGFDGNLASEREALNVPAGRSYWEFGTNLRYKEKVGSDFKSRTEDVGPAEQAQITLVLVTPWTWDSSDSDNKIEDWVSARKSESAWKDVRLIDGAILENWLAECPAVAAWHARHKLNTQPREGVRSTDEFWSDYAGQFGPAVTEEVLLCEREDAAKELIQSLMVPPASVSLVADSPDEVVAFAIAAIRKASPEIRYFLEARTLVVDTIASGRQLLGHKGLVLLLRDDATRSPAQFAVVGSTLVPLGRQQRRGNIPVLNRPSGQAMGKALQSMGFGENEALTLARGCGRSLTALARLRPGGSSALPRWTASGSALLPAILAGSWDSTNENDVKVIQQIAGGQPYRSLETSLRPFLADSDPPFDQQGAVWKVRAPMDAFMRVGSLIGAENARWLHEAMLGVFGTLEPEEGPDEIVMLSRPSTAGHSEWLRDGLATTLLMLAVWGEIAQVNLDGESGQAFVNRVVGDLPGLHTDYRLLTSLRMELPLLAEAAPSPLLSALEQMLEGNADLIRPIFNETEGLFANNFKHTGVIWALETLAWDPAYFRRAVLALVRLAEIDPGSRNGNRPFHSLQEIFVLWNPNTNASPQLRLATLDEVTKVAPKIGWRLIVSLFPSLYGSSSPTAKPRLRDAGASERNPVTNRELWEGHASVIERALRLVGDDEERWSDIIASVSRFPSEFRKKAAEALTGALGRLSSEARDRLWTSLRDEVAKHDRFRTAKWALPESELEPLKSIVERFAPTDKITRIAWLFDTWALDSAGDLKAAELQRAEAVKALYGREGTAGILALVKMTKLPFLVVQAINDAALHEDVLLTIFNASYAENGADDITVSLGGIYRRLAGAVKAQAWLANAIDSGLAEPQAVARLFLAWPDELSTWTIVRGFGEQITSVYWRERSPRRIEGSRCLLLRGTLMLLRYGRASTALQSALDRLEDIPSRLLVKMLGGVIPELNSGAIKPDTMLNFYIGKGLTELDARKDVPLMQIVSLEYGYLPLLEHEERSLRIYDLMAESPEFYHRILQAGFITKSEAASASRPERSKKEQSQARLSYSLLSKFTLVPGQKSKEIDAKILRSWIDDVRRLGVETDRAEITDSYVGRMLAHAIADADGGWPHRVVREEIERLASSQIEHGLMIERFNMRGVFSKALFEGGGQERDFARVNLENAKLTEAWPRTSAMLRAIAAQWEADAKRADLHAEQHKLRS